MNGNDLINTKFAPEGLDVIRRLAYAARAYHALCPYPVYGFTDWKVEERGKLPQCLPFTRNIVRRGAKWLFGKDIDIVIANSNSMTDLLGNVWREKRMPAKLVTLAEKAALDGSYCLKYFFDEKGEMVFTILSTIDHVRWYTDPLDEDKVLMARVQFPYFDTVAGRYFMYREEWTDDKWVKYKPMPVKYITGTGPMENAVMLVLDIPGVPLNKAPDSPDVVWNIEKVEPNRFKTIPMVKIYNLDANSAWGLGDLWYLFNTIDRVNLTYHLMDKSNQFDSVPTTVYIDAVLEDDAIGRPLAPGEQQSIKTDDIDGSGLQAKVASIEPGGKLRPYMSEYTKDLMTQVYKASGSVDVDPDSISNKGNLTQSVLAQIYGPLIETTNDKRRNYGTYGLVPFIDKLLYSMRESGLWRGRISIPKEPAIDLRWADFFPLSEGEIQQRLDRMIQQENVGLTTKDRVIRVMAEVDGITDIQALANELKNYEPQLFVDDPNELDKVQPEAVQLSKKKDKNVTIQ